MYEDTPESQHLKLQAGAYLEDLCITWEQLKEKRILDLGAGLGEFAAEAKKHGIDVVSIDLHPEWHGGKINKTAPYVIADALHLPFQNEAFDLVLSRAAVHSAVKSQDDVRNLIGEVMRTLKDNGEFRFGPGHLGANLFPTNEAFSKEELKYIFGDQFISQRVERYNQKTIELLKSINPTTEMFRGNPRRSQEDGVYYRMYKQPEVRTA